MIALTIGDELEGVTDRRLIDVVSENHVIGRALGTLEDSLLEEGIVVGDAIRRGIDLHTDMLVIKTYYELISFVALLTENIINVDHAVGDLSEVAGVALDIEVIEIIALDAFLEGDCWV